MEGLGIDIVVVGKIAGVLAYSALEFWLGKTEKLKSGSVMEIVFNLAKVVVKRKPKV